MYDMAGFNRMQQDSTGYNRQAGRLEAAGLLNNDKERDYDESKSY